MSQIRFLHWKCFKTDIPEGKRNRQPHPSGIILSFVLTASQNACRQGVILAVLRACDIPLAAGLSALMIAYRASLSYPTTEPWMEGA